MSKRFVLVVACVLIMSGMAGVAAQSATPVATPVGDDAIPVLFVQTGTGSTLAPLDAPDGEATHELTISGGTDQSVFFADRPNREVGSVPTIDMVDSFNDAPGSPPNAALLVQTADGAEEIVVVVLLSGEVDAATDDVIYQVGVLSDFTGVDVELESQPVSSITEAREYGTSHLFIDDWCITNFIFGPIVYPC